MPKNTEEQEFAMMNQAASHAAARIKAKLTVTIVYQDPMLKWASDLGEREGHAAMADIKERLRLAILNKARHRKALAEIANVPE